jgi:hypothetical protein
LVLVSVLIVGEYEVGTSASVVAVRGERDLFVLLESL